MSRPLLEEARVLPALHSRLGGGHEATVREVQEAASRHPVVVVGMAQNPFVKRARKALDEAGVAHHDLDYGSYFAAWRPRLALKMWSGWPTFPMVFVHGSLVGGADDVRALIASGELKRLLAR